MTAVALQVQGQLDGAGVVLDLESKDETLLVAANEKLKSMLPEGCIISEVFDKDVSRPSEETERHG